MGHLRIRLRKFSVQRLRGSGMSRRLFQGALALFLTLTAQGAVAAPPADLDAFVARSMKTFGPPGMSVAIVENGKPVLARGYGIRSIAKPDKVDAHTAFPIGS